LTQVRYPANCRLKPDIARSEGRQKQACSGGLSSIFAIIDLLER
jgi:hypothetical protein